jgi:hypothetical protein
LYNHWFDALTACPLALQLLYYLILTKFKNILLSPAHHLIDLLLLLLLLL